jgi:ABC-type transporter Mla subunit MlaD
MTDFNEQIQKMFQPSTQLFTANAKVLEMAMAQQSSLVSSFISTSLDFNKQLLEQKDLTNIQKISEQFGKTITDQVTSSNKELVAAITDANNKSSEIIKEIVETAQQTLKQQATK